MRALEHASNLWSSYGTSEGQQWCSVVSTAFETVRAYLTPTEPSPTRKHQSAEIQQAFKLIRQQGAASTLFSDALDILNEQFGLVRADLQPYFDALEAQEEEDDEVVLRVMAEILERAIAWQRAWAGPMRIFDDASVMTTYTTLFQHLLYASVPEEFPEQFRRFLTASLAAVAAHEQDDGGEAQEAQVEMEASKRKKRVAAPSPHLHRLTTLPRYSTTLLRVAYDEIEKIAREEAAVGWEEKRLPAARARLSETVVPWMSAVFETHDNPQSMLRSMYSRFDYFLCKAFFDIRTDELFDIIVAYPDSLAALEDLRECLIRVDQRNVLVEKLKASNLKRLLHPGAETKDVITQYISTIRCLRILEPLGALLHKVAEPIRRHLRERPDTIRCIVATLVEGEDLQDENESAEPLASSNDPMVEKFWDAKWEPEPIDAAPEFRTGKAADIVGTLVSIYETKEVIVKELQSYLAMRLLAISDYDSVKELRTIELLKLRFGEEALHVCDVMLKDMADSKRIDDHVHGDIDSVVHPLIISRMFWPSIPASGLHLTPKLQSAQQKYEAAFHHFKPDKRLRWLQEMGKVGVKLELEDRVVSVQVTPLEASVVELFEGQDTWTEDALTEKLGVDALALRGALAVWAGHGVLKEETEGSWRLLETVEEGASRSAYVVESKAPAFESVDEERAAKGSMYWTYIRGLLTNLGPQKVTTMQRALCNIKDYDLTIDELSLFLAAAKREGQVQQKADGSWVLM